MSLLWVKAGWADASPEARERRVQRVRHWLDSQPATTDYSRQHAIEIPDHFGPSANQDYVHHIIRAHTSWYDHGHMLGNVHSHHLPWKEVPLDGHFHTTQGTVRPEIVRNKIDAEHGDDEDWGPSEAQWDEHDPTDDPIIIKHEGEHYLMDGHHRFVQHRLLGQPTMHARVYDADDPQAGPDHCYDCREHKEYCSDCGDDED